ncbi:MAG: hypothetical protein HRU41_22805 [Saprospiraceae bacterium]|nr:hypothetical protein [Saprospiraceae bacterium]
MNRILLEALGILVLIIITQYVIDFSSEDKLITRNPLTFFSIAIASSLIIAFVNVKYIRKNRDDQ